MISFCLKLVVLNSTGWLLEAFPHWFVHGRAHTQSEIWQENHLSKSCQEIQNILFIFSRIDTEFLVWMPRDDESKKSW